MYMPNGLLCSLYDMDKMHISILAHNLSDVSAGHVAAKKQARALLASLHLWHFEQRRILPAALEHTHHQKHSRRTSEFVSFTHG